jgi:hypothetical protein
MPRGKKQGNRPSAGGIKRVDYHRPNRKENKSTHRHSFGRNVSVNAAASVMALLIPRFSREGLTQRALADWKNRHNAEYRLSNQKTSVERKCFEYIRHRQVSLSETLTRCYGAAYLSAVRQFCDAVIERYDWLRDECERYYNQKAAQKRFRTYKVLKRSLTSLHVEEFNEKENQQPETLLTEEEETPLFFKALNSLDQSRFLYLPPFLKPDQVRERRFGENANDRWWEWEKELGLESDAGRPDPKNAQF